MESQLNKIRIFLQFQVKTINIPIFLIIIRKKFKYSHEYKETSKLLIFWFFISSWYLSSYIPTIISKKYKNIQNIFKIK